jgi:flagellin
LRQQDKEINMRIQHNIMAMNSYRNYNNNTSALSSNLEKLSSGYKINRAGDDAAGLAISEKMRAQITGLDQAADNVKDGISLVKTAEGALQEVQDMLNRMVELATQSANGTYDDDVDRANLQSEVDALMSEIDRIADSSNFNGINLLDGSLAGVADISTTAAGKETTLLNSGQLAKFSIDFNSVTVATNTSLYMDSVAVLTAGTSANITDIAGELNGKTVTIDGVEYTATKDTTTTTKVNFVATGKSDYTVTQATIQSKIKNNTTNITQTLSGTQDGKADKKTTNAVTTLDFTGKSGKDVIGNTVTIGDKTYEFVTGTTASGDNVAVTVAEGDNAGAIATKLEAAAKANLTADGYETYNDQGVLQIHALQATTTAAKVTQSGGLGLQIGDTSDTFNQMSVTIGDMHTNGEMAVSGISVADQKSAQEAVSVIKTAINKVSSTRGDLGAIQNRLEHTSNNLSVMSENIQDAESTIRDTDIAEEMMAYTKNNILVQSAQAMLAQANQIPQGVLQLLQ